MLDIYLPMYQKCMAMSASPVTGSQLQAVQQLGVKEFSTQLEDLGSSMANPADSTAHFEERARAYQLPEQLLTELRNNGIRTLGHLAFAIFRPGSEFDENVFNQWARDLNQGVAPTMGALAALRRLHFESEVVLTAALKASVETVEPGTPKAIPVAERSARLDALRTRLVGVNISGVGEPSHALIDECCHQYETRTLRYIDPTRCTSRELEVTSGKADKKIKLDAGSLTVREQKTVPDETVSTTYHLAQCLRRRGIALDFANLVSFTTHEQYSEQLLKHLSIEPPPGYAAPTLHQIMRADKEVFSYLAQRVPDIRPIGNVKPLDAAFGDALRDYNTTFHLLPLPRNMPKPDAPAGVPSFTAEPYPTRTKGRGKSRGAKGKTQFASSYGSTAAPRGYPGCVGKDGKNRPLCFDFNIGQCDKAPAGGTCPKGRRVCFLAGCFKIHAYKDAHGAPAAPKQKE